MTDCIVLKLDWNFEGGVNKLVFKGTMNGKVFRLFLQKIPLDFKLTFKLTFFHKFVRRTKVFLKNRIFKFSQTLKNLNLKIRLKNTAGVLFKTVGFSWFLLEAGA